MAYITAAYGARKIADKGLSIYLSQHADKRIGERLVDVAPKGTDMDRWASLAIVNAIVSRTFTSKAPRDYYDDGANREDDACFYAVAELRAGMPPVCIVFAVDMQKREVIIVTVLWPLDNGGAREVHTYGAKATRQRQQQRTQTVGGHGRMRRAS